MKKLMNLVSVLGYLLICEEIYGAQKKCNAKKVGYEIQ